MGKQFRFLGTVVLVASIAGFATGCRETQMLVAAIECEQGYTQDCTSARQCAGAQQCMSDGRWGPCLIPLGSPMDCTPPPPPECDSAAAQTEDKPCYTGAEGTKWKGICRPGFEVCTDNKFACAFQQTPQARNCTNGLDNDCDGTIDAEQRSNVTMMADIVLFIDESQSMGPYFDVIRMAIQQFSETSALSPTQIQIAAVGMPHGGNGKCGVITNFTTPGAASQAIDALVLESIGTGNEPSIDCPYLAALPENPLGLQYRPGIKKTFISFTDEFAQSYLEPKISALMSGQMMASQGIPFFNFDRQSVRSSFIQMTTLTGGRSFELERSYAAIQQDLVNLFHRVVCVE